MLNECDRQLILFGISLLILLILTTIIYRALFPNPNIEGYDGKISNVTLNQCGTECTIGENCRAFAYKPVSSTCYLSKTNILGQPVQSAYVKDYSKLDQRCNKINPLNDINFIGDVGLTANSVYVCSDGEANKTTQFQYANLGSSSLESSGVIGGSAGRGVPTHIGDVPDYQAPLAVNYDVYSIKYIDPEIEPLKDLTPNFPKLIKQNDAEIRLSQAKTKAKPDKNIVVIGGESETARSAFIESDMEFLGQYMLGHQCVLNVPFYDCIKFCDQNDKCAGTEWNEAVIRNTEDGTQQIYSNVCCPKQLIKKIVPRRKEHLNGKFYVKTDLNKIKGRDSILLSRQNVHKPLGISDLNSTIDSNPRFSLQVTDRTTPDIYLASQQSMNDVSPLTNIILPGDNEKINLS